MTEHSQQRTFTDRFRRMQPTDLGMALTHRQMAKALRLGEVAAHHQEHAADGWLPMAADHVPRRGRRLGATITAGMLVVGALTMASVTENPHTMRDSGRSIESGLAARGSIPGPAAAPSGRDRAHASAARAIQTAASSQEHSDMLRSFTGVAVATAIGVSATVAGAQSVNQVFQAPTTSSGVIIPHVDAQNAPIAAGTMTIEFWIRYQAGEGRVVNKRGCSYEGYTVACRAHARGAEIVVGFGTGVVDLVWVAGSLPANEWHHIALVWDHHARSLRFVLDGVTVNSVTTTETQVPGTESNPLQFGENCGWGFRGAMDNIRIWSVTRTDSEILADAYRQFSNAEASKRQGLIGSWNFETESQVIDQAGVNPDGQFYGSGGVIPTDIPDGILPCTGDLSSDGIVDGADLGALLANWGPVTGAPESMAADINRDGDVNGSDLGLLLARWGNCQS